MKRKIIIVFLSVFLVILLVAGGFTGYMYLTYKKATENPGVSFAKEKEHLYLPKNVPGNSGAGNRDEDNGSNNDIDGKGGDYKGDNTKQDKYRYNEDLVNILLVGYDRTASRDKVYSGYRSDTLILGTVDLKTKEAFMLTIPRDTRTMVRKLNKDGSVKGQSLEKICHAFAYNGGKKENGYKNSMYAVSNLLGGIPVNYYVGIDMDDFIRIVDAVDGVAVDVDVNIPEVGLKKGYQTLKGQKALAYVQMRKIPGTDGSDIERTKRQKKFVVAFLSKVKTLGPVKVATSLFPSMIKYVDTNLTFKQIISLATVLQDISISDIKNYQVPGYAKTLGGYSYWIVDREELDKLVKELYFVKEE